VRADLERAFPERSMPSQSASQLPPGHEPLRRWERNSLIAVLVIVVAFCALVVNRSALQEVRRTDAGAYFRAGWAIRNGMNPYEVPDARDLHLAYPPVAAIMFSPLADAPPENEREWMLSYEASIIVWIVLTVLATFLASHWFALALEESARDPALRSPPRGSRRWWYNRMLPIYVCIAPIGGTFSRGQITPILLMLIAGMFLATVRGKRFASGLWLAAAICLKIIPGLLLVFPLIRRDWRALWGVATGVFIGVVMIPTAELGITGAIKIHEQYADHMIKPALGLGGTKTMHFELMSMNRPGDQSLKSILHNYQNWDRESRPDKASRFTTVAHPAISLMLVGGLAFAYGWRRPHDTIGMLTMIGGLFTLMCIVSPKSHTHYFFFAIPLMMALAARSLEAHPDRLVPTAGTLSFLIFAGFCYALVMVPFWEYRREVGIPLYASLMLWIAAIVQLRREPALLTAVVVPEPLQRARAA
jgi:alpha-1,2-mannosyltransferase